MNRGALFLLLGSLPGFHEASASDFKKYIPQEFRHYVPESSGEDSNFEGEFDEDLNIFPQESVNKESVSSYGPHSYASQKFENLKVYGPTHLEKVAVEGKTLIYGPLAGNRLVTKNLNVQGPVNLTALKSETLEVNGPVTLKKAIVRGELIINGPLVAYQADLGKISIATTKMKLVDTTAESIVVRKNSGLFSGPQKVFLSGKTLIKKGILFEEGEGLVTVDKEAAVKGDVRGGKIVQKTSP